jgi:putative phosphoesterase
MEQVIADLGGQVDEILLAGDAMYEYRFSNEVIELIIAHQVRYITGNHEQVILGPDGRRALAAPTIRRSNLDFLRTVPDHLTVNVGGKRLMMTHASPWPPYKQYLHANDPLLERADELDVDFLVLGHTHVPMEVRAGHTLVLNPGSLEQSREAGHYDTISYAILDTESERLEVIRKPAVRG